MASGWLKCFIQKGMFSDELAVNYPPREACASSVFVPKDEVRGQVGREGKVKVRYFAEGETVWAVLPAEDQPVIRVHKADLVP